MTHRPELHVTAGIGILDAPAGALLSGNDWHIFHQFRPRTTEGARWAHQFAEDTPFVFEECDDVLAPREPETELRAGSVVAFDRGVGLYYTSVTTTGCAISLAYIEDLAATTETVSDTASDVDSHVNIIGTVIDDQHGFQRFRSPCVVPDWCEPSDHEQGHSGWLMVAVADDAATHTATVVVLRSADGRDWAFLGPLNLEGDTGLERAHVVAPRIIRLLDEVQDDIFDVLVVTVEHKGVDVSGYIVGKLHGTTFTASRPFSRIDHGHDFTRPRNTNLCQPTGTLSESYKDTYLFGLMNGVGKLDDAYQHESYTREHWANCLSLPRRVTLQGGVLYQTPASGLVTAVEESDHALMFTGVFDIPTGESITIELLDSIGQVAATVTHFGDRLELDRSMNPYHREDTVAVALLDEDDTDALTVVTDGSTVEVFADGGQVAMASRVYFNGQCEDFAITRTTNAGVHHSDVIAPTMSALRGYNDDFYEGAVR